MGRIVAARLPKALAVLALAVVAGALLSLPFAAAGDAAPESGEGSASAEPSRPRAIRYNTRGYHEFMASLRNKGRSDGGDNSGGGDGEMPAGGSNSRRKRGGGRGKNGDL